MGPFKPFENDEQSWSAGEGDGLTINNGTDAIQVYGEVKFAPTDAGRQAASELLAIFVGASAQLAPAGSDEKALWVKNRAGALTIGGDVDLTKAVTGTAVLAKAIAGLEKFVAQPKLAASPAPKA